MSEAFDRAFGEEPQESKAEESGTTETQETPAEAVPTEEAKEVPAEEKGVETEAKDEAKEAEPKPESPSGNEPMIPLARLNQEIEKRAQAEARLRLVETPKEETKPDPRPNADEDPEGAVAHVEQSVKGDILNAKVDMSIAMSKNAHDDFDAVMQGPGKELASIDPGLMERAYQQVSPAEYLYDQAKQHQALQEIGDPVKFGETKYQEGYEKAKAEAAAAQDKEDVDGLPESLASERSVGDRDTQADPPSTAFDKVFPD